MNSPCDACRLEKHGKPWRQVIAHGGMRQADPCLDLLVQDLHESMRIAEKVVALEVTAGERDGVATGLLRNLSCKFPGVFPGHKEHGLFILCHETSKSKQFVSLLRDASKFKTNSYGLFPIRPSRSVRLFWIC